MIEKPDPEDAPHTLQLLGDIS